MNTILLFGADGLLGQAILQQALEKGRVWAPSEREVDIRDSEGVEARVNSISPDLIINSAAIVDVTKCEREPKLARSVHVEGAAAVARSAVAVGARHVLVSTDYVFGSHPDDGLHGDTDPTGPINEYGRTKLAGEERVLDIDPNSLVVRVGILFGHGRPTAIWHIARNLLKGIPIEVYDDVNGSPTPTDECVAHIFRALDAGLSGIIHCAGSGVANRYELACLIQTWTGRREVPIYRTSWHRRSPARCPRFAGLRNDRLKKAGLDVFSHWTESVPRFLSELRRRGLLPG